MRKLRYQILDRLKYKDTTLDFVRQNRLLSAPNNISALFGETLGTTKTCGGLANFTASHVVALLRFYICD